MESGKKGKELDGSAGTKMLEQLHLINILATSSRMGIG